VERPPHLLPQGLDQVRPLADQARSQIALHGGVHRRAIGAHREGVARAFAPALVTDAHGDQLEVSHLAVRAVGQGHRQLDQIVVGPYFRDGGHDSFARA
jgi:hypothetical protein